VPLITIFTAPKPFTDPRIDVIQRNAIRSWLSLGEDVRVILVGDEAGMSAVASKYGVTQLAGVACNEQGTPLVSSIFANARQASDSPLLTYVNADILLLPDFLAAARDVSHQTGNFLVIGQRWDLDVTQLLDFGQGWEKRLEAEVNGRGRLHPPAGSDYFLFPRQLFSDIPDFAIGRAGWDNWMIYHARQQKWPVIDATPAIRVIHQNHDYSHLPGGKTHYDHPESYQNETLAGGATNLFMVLDSDRQLAGGRIRSPRPSLPRLLRRVELLFTPPGTTRQGWRWFAARRLRRLRRRITKSKD
jgi:hypothetical protein